MFEECKKVIDHLGRDDLILLKSIIEERIMNIDCGAVDVKKVKFSVYQDDSRAGKAWIARASPNWGIVNNSWMIPTEIVKKGNTTTKYYDLPDGRYVANSSGNEKMQERSRVEVKNGQIIKNERFTVPK